jgi:hypothetical protein
MICNEVEENLDEYVDDELPEEVRRAVEEHVRTCLPCRRTLTDLESLLERARRLPTEIEPGDGLWPAIESRISAMPQEAGDSAETRRREPFRWTLHWNPLATAAVLLLAVAAPLTIWQLARSPVEEFPVEQSDLLETASPTAAAMLARSEDGVLLQRTDLLKVLERQRDILPLETIAAIEENARLIDQAIAQVRAALEESPDNRQLELLLAARYQQEVALLKQVNRV